MRESGMELKAETRGDVLKVSVLADRIDAASAIQFKDRMRELTEGAPARVLLDMGEVDFIDSSGLGAIVSVMKTLDDGSRLELAALSPKVVKVFRLTRMDGVFTIHQTVEAAASGASAA